MSADHDLHADLTERLRALGRLPVDPALQSEHLTAMAGVRSGGSVFRSSLAGRLKVGAGVLAGFLIGATGLTTAGAMGPLQPIAADIVEAVAPVDVPKGKSDEAKAKAKAAGEGSRLEDGSIGTQRIWDDGCEPSEAGGTTFAGNRGQYLKQERAKGQAAFEAAKLTDCGKPVGGDDDGDDADVESTEAPATEGAENGKAGEDHGKSEGKGKADDAGTAGESGKPESPGRSDDAPAGEKPGSVPSPTLPEAADDEATEKAPVTEPGETPADPEAKPEV